MKVKPKRNFKLLGTDIKLSKTKVYNAVIASNIQYYKEKGLIFVNAILLDKDDYSIVKE